MLYAYTAPFYIRGLSMDDFGIHRVGLGSWSQSSADTGADYTSIHSS